jgi:hypothetical protein
MKKNVFHEDFQDFIRELNKADVKYLLVGGYSVILHGYSRTTGDMDIWINPTKTNFRKMLSAFQNFGLPTHEISESDFLNIHEKEVYSFGRPPVCIDILTVVIGLDFDESYKNATWFEIEDDLKVCVIHLQDLIKAKTASDRPRDQNDIDHLTKRKT